MLMIMLTLILILSTFLTDKTMDTKYFSRLYPTNMTKTKNHKVDDYTRNSKSECY